MTTVFDLLGTAIRGRSGTPGGLVPPVPVSWPDRRREWDGLIAVDRSHTPEMLALGDFRPDDRTGPAVLLLCVVDRMIDLSCLPAARLRIIYPLGVTDCLASCGHGGWPGSPAALVELTYRGVACHRPNDRDWSARVLQAQARRRPGEALPQAIGQAVKISLGDLQDCLDASDFNQFPGINVERDMLGWLADSQPTRA